MMKLIGIEEHFVTADIRAAWAASSVGREGTGGFDRGGIEDRLDDSPRAHDNQIRRDRATTLGAAGRS
jgi:hypothetical protein